ncbi:MAG: molybdopterin synthase catalytic subunit MoaE [Rhodocyclaceae bacterium]|nr:molybdopterin synthase catalytic subunit MoaE [Rhodocyclaceae bacterium]
MYLSVQRDDFDVGAELARLRESSAGATTAGGAEAGAIACFVGLVRADNLGEEVRALTLEHYPGMTERALAETIEQTQQRFPLIAVRVIHRYGRLNLGEQIVFVGVSAHHRQAAFSACEFIMDDLKTRAPFWKKEETTRGERWVEARDSDTAARARWEA